MANRADYSRLTEALRSRAEEVVTLSWQELDEIVGGLPASAVKHHPQWWHGERSHTLAWRRAGYTLDAVELGRSVTFHQTGSTTAHPAKARRRSPRPERGPIASRSPHAPRILSEIEPRAALLVIGCSAEKEGGGRPAPVDDDSEGAWPRELLNARSRVLASSTLDSRSLLPAWQRYTGHFYRRVGGSLHDAVTHGRVVILSGGYGVVRGDERIGYYDHRLRASDWPQGLLQRLLVEEARRVGARTVVGFVARTSEYAKLLRRVDWSGVGIQALAVSIDYEGGGAQRVVPQRLGQAFGAFWRQALADYPEGMIVEMLA